MACNVYGTPVTDATLKGMTEYHDKAITAVDRARVAMQMKNAEGKDTAARNFADTLQRSIDENGVRCLLYNATGGPLKLVTFFQFSGSVTDSPVPTVIQNGQWACFAHGKTLPCEYNSCMGVVYEATKDPARQWVLGWFCKEWCVRKCYAEIREKGYYSKDSWGDVYKSLKTSIEDSKNINNKVKYEDAIIFSSIGTTYYPIYEAVMTMEGAI